MFNMQFGQIVFDNRGAMTLADHPGSAKGVEKSKLWQTSMADLDPPVFDS
jgi:hypothetical protein